MKNLILFFFLLIGLTSCDNSYQYDVYAKNTTQENINIIFKSPNNNTGTDEQTIVLKPGEQKRIISTNNIGPKKKETTMSEHCQRAAEYVRAFQGEHSCKLNWCSEKIKFELEDIGQWTYTIEYKPEHF